MRTGILLSGALPPDLRDDISYRTGSEPGPEPSKTVQSEKENVDINVIVKRFGVTGQLPNVRIPRFGDFTEVYDYHSAMNAVAEARSSFMQLPADVRARFKNDPQAFIEFATDSRNIDELRKMGLANKLNEDIVPKETPANPSDSDSSVPKP